MAVGKESIKRAAKAVEATAEAPVKEAPAKKPAAKKAPAKKAPAKKAEAKGNVIVSVGTEMPTYLL